MFMRKLILRIMYCWSIYDTALKGGGEDMMAMIWAQQIMLGKKSYAQVPRLLKEQVAEILRDSGMEHLIVE